MNYLHQGVQAALVDATVPQGLYVLHLKALVLRKRLVYGVGVQTSDAPAAAHEILSEQTGNQALAQQALFAFVDALAKTILTCLPEPAGEAYNQAVARARFGYDRFVKSVGQGMVGEAGLALARLIHDEDGRS